MNNTGTSRGGSQAAAVSKPRCFYFSGQSVSRQIALPCTREAALSL